MQPSRDIARLIEIMAALRAPETGCAWDLKQNFASIAPYTIEEAYEVADAIERGDLIDLRDELGDLLLQVVFHARMAQEQGAFDFGGVVEAITSKMIRRHPHVFGDADHIAEEIGDILFVVTNLARHAKTDPERVLRAANAKFERRFGYIEQKMVETDRDIAAASLEDMDFYWNEAKSKGL